MGEVQIAAGEKDATDAAGRESAATREIAEERSFRPTAGEGEPVREGFSAASKRNEWMQE